MRMALLSRVLLFLLFSLLLAVQATSVLVCNDSADCLTLLEFKRGITSDRYGRLRSWTEANPFCNWTGVTCLRNLPNRIASLRLDDMLLEGILSPSLSNLSLLTTLSLRNNTFDSHIPSSLGRLSKLTYLDLSENNLQGRIPGSLKDCRNLKFLDLTGNNISGVVPEELGLLKNLTDLCISVNLLTGQLPSLSNLTVLRRLELGVNYFTGKIPLWIGELRRLEVLYFHTNYFEGPIPSAICNCTALREISGIENLLSGEIPTEIGLKMRSLERIYLMRNKLTGKIPPNLSNISQLILFDVSLNFLSGEVPMEFGRLKNLENLYLHSNDLVSGGDNSSLRFLTSLTNCTRLQKLHLGSCLFAGALPDSIGSLSKKLFYFNLLNNRITRKIPESIGNLTGLVTLELFYNFLTGEVPSSFGNLKLLQRLNLGRNKLTGEIPGEIGKMTRLGSLILSNNSVTGEIPHSLCDSGQLRYLHLSRNRLSGTLPVELTRCSLLMSLDLSYNRLRGSIPIEFGLFPNLALMLNLSNNDFEGKVPETIGKLISIEVIDFSSNRISGVIPSSIGSCIALEYLNFSYNFIEGSIPEPLKQIRYLESLDLSHNRLNGTVPNWIASYEKLKLLNLSYNRLSGEVPRNGSFVNFSRSSFLGNEGLCGGSPRMGLPSCKLRRKKQDMKTKVLYLVFAVMLGILILVFVTLVIWYFWKRTKEQDSIALSVPPSPKANFPRSYTERELEIATNGFSEDNLLGSGSFGSVYKAIIDNENTIVAVKVLREESAQNFQSLKRECEILSEIKHRNLLKIVGLVWNIRFKALVLEFIPNGSLENHLYPNGVEENLCKLTLEERISIALDIANGLEYLQIGCPTQIVHCDLKPQNVLIDYDMVAHIADFGIGKLLLDKPNGNATTTGFLRGSIGYIPPEYGQGFEASAKGDIYSFGIMLLEMITRRRPTSDMFTHGLNLRKWVVSSFPSNIMDIVDNELKLDARFAGSIRSIARLEECCGRALNIALMCTEMNPNHRPRISLVVQTLLSIARDSITIEELDDIKVSKERNRTREDERSMLHEFT